jgi:hypothetical protein
MRVLESHGGSSQGTTTELLDALTAHVGEKTIKQKTWPTRPNALTNRLKRLAPALRAVGITIERDREGHTGNRIVRVEMKVKDRHRHHKAISKTTRVTVTIVVTIRAGCVTEVNARKTTLFPRR